MKYLFLISIFTFFALVPGYCQQSDVSLRRVRDQDVYSRNTSGDLQTLSAAEHLSRAETYSSNRLFPEAREHWTKLLTNYPADPGVPKALFGIARSFMWERQYDKAVEWFDRLTKDHLRRKTAGRDLLLKVRHTYGWEAISRPQKLMSNMYRCSRRANVSIRHI